MANLPSIPSAIANNAYFASNVYNQDPNKVRTTVGGQGYNYAGDPVGSPVVEAQNKYSDLLKQIRDLSARANQKVYAPALNYAQINAQARAQAESAVNPLYVKRLNDFLTQQAAKQQQRQQQYELDIGGIQDTLKQRLEQAGIEKTRTQEDVAQNLADIANQADVFQTDTGQQFEQGREALGTELAASGLGTSGIGKQKVAQAVEQQNTAEQRQVEKFKSVRTQQELFRSRSLEDLMRGEELSTTAAEKGKKQAKFDLDTYIQNLGFETGQGKEQLEEERLGSIVKEEERQRGGLVQSFIQSINNPAQREAAYGAYGGLI